MSIVEPRRNKGMRSALRVFQSVAFRAPRWCFRQKADQHAHVVAPGRQLSGTWEPRNPLAPITNFFAPAMR
jgi:hypothetical protein